MTTTRRRSAPKRHQWRGPASVRFGLAAGAAVLALFALADSLANGIARGSPSLAHKLAPWDGKIAAQLARRQFDISPGFGSHVESALLARSALHSEPTAVDALDVLALQAQLRNEPAQSRQMLSHSLLLSRRQLPPRLWAIEEAALRGDVDGALANYDIALRTSNAAAPRLFPILSAALTERSIRTKLVDILARRPVWREGFVSHAARAGLQPAATARFFAEAERRGIPIDNEMRTALVDNIASRHSPQEAWAYFASVRPGVARNRSGDPRFEFRGQRRSLFDWNASNFATFQRDAQGGLLEFEVPATGSGPLASQVMVLPPGRYVLRGTTGAIDASNGAFPYWSLRCGTREIGEVPVDPAAASEGQFSGYFSVPTDCKVQTLALVARSTDRAVTGQITSVQLEPAK